MPIRELLSTTEFFCEPLALISSDGTFDTGNRPFLDELGLSAQALASKRLDALAAVSASAIQEFLSACAQSAAVVHGSLVLRRDSRDLTLQARGIAYPPSAAPSASHVLLRLMAQREQGHDTSFDRQSQHWREVEGSLRRQSQILEVTLASIGDAVIVTDANARVTFLSPVAEELTGWSSRAARGQLLREVFHIINEQTRLRAEDPAAKVLETGRVVGLANHTVLISRDGREIPIDDSAAPIRLPGGELFGIVLIFRDITEQRRAEHTRSWLASIVESSDDAIVSKTLDGLITSWNPGAQQLFGYAPKEIIGEPITTIVPPELHEEESGILERLRQGERIDHFETTRITKDGRRIEVSLTVSPVRDEAGVIVGASKIARDITERKRAERMLREADRRKDEFLATLAHELRNPLAPLRHAAELLRRDRAEQPRSLMACDVIDRQLHQMTRLVEDLLDVSRIVAGRIELDLEPIEMGSLLRTIEGSLRPTFEAQRQQLSLTFPSAPLHVTGDRIRLVQVFSNILQNASKYTPASGIVAVNVQREQSQIVVRVRDDGIGIPPDKLDEVFELFAQVDPSQRRSLGGLGIGLTVAKRLIDLHGGRIEARSAGEGHGSEFIVRLPTHAGQPENAPHTRVRASLDSPPRRILIVDDNQDAALSLSLLLSSTGHETEVAHDGVAALQAAEAFRPEIIILDIEMPKLDGYEVARRIAEQPWPNKPLLVALTGRAQESDRERARAAGFHHYLVKPVDLEALQAVLAQTHPAS
jgi:PAS domain S-box-containing protein